MHAATARCLWDCEELLLPLPPLRAAGGGRELAACVAGGSRDGRAKKGLDKGKGEGELKDGFVLSCCLILLLFFGLPFSMQVY